MRERAVRALRSSAKVLAVCGAAALGLAAAVFVFALVAHGLDAMVALDWTRKLMLLLGALCLIVGGCGLLVSGRDRPEGGATPGKDDTFRTFRHEVGMTWGAAVSLAAVDFLVLGTVADLLYFSLSA